MPNRGINLESLANPFEFGSVLPGMRAWVAPPSVFGSFALPWNLRGVPARLVILGRRPPVPHPTYPLRSKSRSRFGITFRPRFGTMRALVLSSASGASSFSSLSHELDARGTFCTRRMEGNNRGSISPRKLLVAFGGKSHLFRDNVS